jgi:esterase/lipase
VILSRNVKALHTSVAVSVGGVVLVHGGLNTSACWDSMLVHVEAPVVALDLPGRGSSPAEITAVTLDDCVHAVIDSADHAGFEQFALIGHSLGGVTITETAWRHPERVAPSTTSFVACERRRGPFAASLSYFTADGKVDDHEPGFVQAESQVVDACDRGDRRVGRVYGLLGIA